MPLLIQYLIKLSLTLGFVWAFYQLLLRRLTFYNWNRAFLISYSLIAFFIPFINISPVIEKNELSANRLVQLIPLVQTFASGNERSSIGVWDWVLIVFLVGCVVLLVRLVILHVSFVKLRRSAKLLLETPVKLYQIDKDIIPFSFGDSIFINQDQHKEEDLPKIIRHEFVHVKQKHSIDMLWAEWLCVLNWYNPFAWLVRNAIRQNLEFIADNNVIQNGIDKKQYQYLLLKVMGAPQYSIAANFNFTSLKKRIAMMNKMRTAKVHLMKFLFVLPLIGVLLLSFRDKMSRQKKAPVVQHVSLVQDTIPTRPAPPAKPVLPKNVRSLVSVNNKVSVTLKDGTVEKYDLNNAEEKALFEKKFGPLPEPPAPPEPLTAIEATPPAPPVPPVVPSLPANVSSININNNKATIKHKDGNVETYDLNKPDDKTHFEKKYGEVVPVVPKAPKTPKAPAPMIAPVSISTTTVVGLDPVVATEVTAPVSLAVSPLKVNTTVSADIIDVQPVIHELSGWESDEIIAEISKGITPTELAQKAKQLLDVGYVLGITKTNYTNGMLQSIEGTIADAKNKSRFVADDFSKIVISKIRYRDGKSAFNIRIHNGAIRL